MTSLTQTENKTIEQNLIWLEHEIKINEAIATSQETKAKVNVLSLAISSISELSSTIRELKNKIQELEEKIIESDNKSNKIQQKHVLIGFENHFPRIGNYTTRIETNNLFYSKPIFVKLNSTSDELRGTLKEMLNLHALASYCDRPMLYLDIINELPVVKNNEFKKLFSCYLLRKFSLYESDNNSVFKQGPPDCSHIDCRRIDEELVSKYPKIFTIYDPCSSDGYI